MEQVHLYGSQQRWLPYHFYGFYRTLFPFQGDMDMRIGCKAGQKLVPTSLPWFGIMLDIIIITVTNEIRSRC